MHIWRHYVKLHLNWPTNTYHIPLWTKPTVIKAINQLQHDKEKESGKQSNFVASHRCASFDFHQTWHDYRVCPCHHCTYRRNNRVDRGRLVPQLLGWWTNNVLGPNFLAVVFKKQEISQQVLLLMSTEATRMQDLASAFSKIFRRWYPRTPRARGAHPQPGLWPGTNPWSSSTFQPWLRPWLHP